MPDKLIFIITDSISFELNSYDNEDTVLFLTLSEFFNNQ